MKSLQKIETLCQEFFNGVSDNIQQKDRVGNINIEVKNKNIFLCFDTWTAFGENLTGLSYNFSKIKDDPTFVVFISPYLFHNTQLPLRKTQIKICLTGLEYSLGHPGTMLVYNPKYLCHLESAPIPNSWDNPILNSEDHLENVIGISLGFTNSPYDLDWSENMVKRIILEVDSDKTNETSYQPKVTDRGIIEGDEIQKKLSELRNLMD
jgi:hypothetical protein